MKRFKSFLIFLFALIFALPSIGFASWFIVSQKDVDPIDVQATNERAVAYVEEDNLRYTLHRSVALAKEQYDAQTGNKTNVKVYIVPSSGPDGKATIIDINEPLIIPDGVELYVPYENKIVENSFDATVFKKNSLADQSLTAVLQNRKTLINLNSTITIQPAGKIYLGGAFGSYGIVGSYCEINLTTLESQIICNGSFFCYGYVKQPDLNGTDNRKLIINDGGVASGVFAIYSNPMGSGSIFTGLASNKVLPIDRFDFPNLQTKVIISQGSKFRAKIHMDLGATLGTGASKEIFVVGPEGSAQKEMFYMSPGQFSDYVQLTYIPKSRLYTNTTAGQAHSEIEMYSNVTLGFLEIKETGFELSTADMALPVSYLLHITLKQGSTFNANYSLKFLGGSKLTVDQGATLNVNNTMVFYDKAATKLAVGVQTYPQSFESSKLTVNGTMKIDQVNGRIGGTVHTTNKGGALIDLSNITADKNLYASVPEGREGTPVSFFLQGFAQNMGEPQERIINFKRGTKIYSSIDLEDRWNETNTTNTKKINIEIKESVYEYSIIFYNITITADDKIIDAGGNTTQPASTMAFVKNGEKDGEFFINENYTFVLTISRTLTPVVDAFDGSGPINFQATPYEVLDGDFSFSIMPVEATLLYIKSSDQKNYSSSTWTTWGDSGSGFTKFDVWESLDGSSEGVQVQVPVHEPGLDLPASDPLKASIMIARNSFFYMKITYEGDTAGTVSFKGQYLDVYTNMRTSNPHEFFVESTAAPTNEPAFTGAAKGKKVFPDKASNQKKATQRFYYYVAENGSLSTCLTEDVLVSMANGTSKPAGEVEAGELLKVFNHETGKIDTAPAIFNAHIGKEASQHNVIYLEFSNNKVVKVVADHGFFDLNTMQYEYINESNYKSFVGHRFATIIDDVIGETMLTNAYIKKEVVKIVSPVSAAHLNIITEDILSISGAIYGFFNFFDFDDNLQYNPESMASDIAKYGLFTYDDFKHLMPYEFFVACGAKYFKVSIGKGMITWEGVLKLIDQFLEDVMAQN